eukprot:g1748.t1
MDSNSSARNKRSVDEVEDLEEKSREVKRFRSGISETMDTEVETPPSPPAAETSARLEEQLLDANASTSELAPAAPVVEPVALHFEQPEEDEDNECPQRRSFEAIYADRYEEIVEDIVPMSPPSEEAAPEAGLPVYGPVNRPLHYTLGRNFPELPDIDSQYRDFPECATGVSRLIYEKKKEFEEIYRVLDSTLEMAEGFSPQKRMVAANKMYARIQSMADNRETFHMMLLILDRYFTSGKASSADYDRFTVIAAASMAWNYLEVPLKRMTSFGMVEDEADLFDYQFAIFEALNYELGTVTLPYFIQRFLLTVELEGHETAEELAMFLADLAVSKYEMLRYSPSLLAATAVYIAHCVYNENTEFTDALVAHSGYTLEKVKECADELVDLFIETREAVERGDRRNKKRVPIEVVRRQPQDVKIGMDILDDVARGSLGVKFGQFITAESSRHDSSSEDETSDGSIYIEGSLSDFKILSGPEHESQPKDGSNDDPESKDSPKNDLDAGPSSKIDARDDSNGGSGSKEGSASEDGP